jgi:hypothetical protein
MIKVEIMGAYNLVMPPWGKAFSLEKKEKMCTLCYPAIQSAMIHFNPILS